MAKYYKPKTGVYHNNVYILTDAPCNKAKCHDGTPLLVDVCTGEVWSSATTFGSSTRGIDDFEQVEKVSMVFNKVSVVEFKI